ncbi:MAG: glycosyl transferase family protein [Pseudomonadota bacterium]
MENWGLSLWQLLALVQHELLLFAGVFFLIGALDDLAIDVSWLWLKLTSRARTPELNRTALQHRELDGPAAIFIPAWQEAEVIGDTIEHILSSWPQSQLRLYIGCYRNDPATIEAAKCGSLGDHRLRIVVHDQEGPTTKADCLNRLYEALRSDERRGNFRFASIVFHDAEDMVDPAALGLLSVAIHDGADFVQIPVEPMVQANSRFCGSHYCEEFAESHGKAMVVRDAFGAGLPGAGVGCAISRQAAGWLANRAFRPEQPFATDSLTEDYELGLNVAAAGGTCRFIRARGAEDGRLIATRAYFPSNLSTVTRQKTRWIHGIALQGWDRVGWNGNLVETWMRARDRRGPITALVLLIGYALIVLAGIIWLLAELGLAPQIVLSPVLEVLLIANFVAFIWRAIWRFAFTASIYGMGEGLFSIVRIPLANVISIIAGRRAVTAYARTLMGRAIEWDKTSHSLHPASDGRPKVTMV